MYRSKLVLEPKRRWASPVPSPVVRSGHWRYTTHANSSWSTKYWEYTLNDTRRVPFWVSDFKHRYLIRTGREHRGVMPAQAPSGMYQGLHRRNMHTILRVFAPANRETRRLPILNLTPRVVYEHKLELKHQFAINLKTNKAILREVRDVELHQWYTKLQRVRGRWCRDQKITSRGVYSPAVDAAELWG
jgi:hypothetical protein